MMRSGSPPVVSSVMSRSGLRPFFFAIERTRKSVSEPRLDTPIFLPLRSSDPFDFGPNHESVDYSGHGVRENRHIGAGEIRADDGRRRDGSYIDAATDQRLRRDPRSVHVMTSASRPYFSYSLASLVIKMNDIAHADARARRRGFFLAAYFEQNPHRPVLRTRSLTQMTKRTSSESWIHLASNDCNAWNV